MRAGNILSLVILQAGTTAVVLPLLSRYVSRVGCQRNYDALTAKRLDTIQVFIYSVTNWNTPHILDMRGATSLIVQAETHFLTLDNSQGVQASQV